VPLQKPLCVVPPDEAADHEARLLDPMADA
jgi:hypothetical protein